jgi:hypothetical protein
MSNVTFSTMPKALLRGEGVTLAAVQVWDEVFTQTLGRPGWDLSHRQLAEATGMGVRTVQRAIEWLAGNGWLIKVPQSADGVQKANLYRVCREPHVPWNVTSTPRGEGLDDQGGIGPSGRHQETHYRENKPSTPDGFEEWWAIYPRKIAKGAAEKAYAKAVELSGPVVLLAGVQRYAAVRANQDPQYTKHPATWLNQKCWLDEISPGDARMSRTPEHERLLKMLVEGVPFTAEQQRRFDELTVAWRGSFK